MANQTRKEKLRATFVNIVKPELKEDFFSNWTKWFVTEETAEDEKHPGKLKSIFIKYINSSLVIFILAEWETGHGTFIALGNKMYQCYCNEKDEFKKSTKGVPTKNHFEMEMFKSVLLDQTTPRQTVTINSLRLNNDKEIARISTTKSSLSDIFVKLRTGPDKITCSPLTRDGKLI